ncbi:MAG: membrane protein insertion efficiency factor YidD [Phycisphaerales bacterium]
MLIRVYRVVFSPVMGGQCRFEPTCSRFGAEAYRLYGPIRGTRMTVGRICRCHPWNKGGFDPVPIPEGVHDRAAIGTNLAATINPNTRDCGRADGDGLHAQDERE